MQYKEGTLSNIYAYVMWWRNYPPANTIHSAAGQREPHERVQAGAVQVWHSVQLNHTAMNRLISMAAYTADAFDLT